MLKPSLAHVQCGVARRGLLLLAALLLFTRGPAVAADAGPPEKVRFNEQIRPILSDAPPTWPSVPSILDWFSGLSNADNQPAMSPAPQTTRCP